MPKLKKINVGAYHMLMIMITVIMLIMILILIMIIVLNPIMIIILKRIVARIVPICSYI